MSPGRAWLEEKLPERKILSRPRVAALLKSARALLTDLRRDASHLSDELGSSNATADLPILGSCLQTPLQIWHSGHFRLGTHRHEVSEALYSVSCLCQGNSAYTALMQHLCMRPLSGMDSISSHPLVNCLACTLK